MILRTGDCQSNLLPGHCHGRYYAVVWGIPIPSEGVIEGNIGRSTRNRKKMAVIRNGGKPAITHYNLSMLMGGLQL